VWLDVHDEYKKLHQPFHISRVKRYSPSDIEWGKKQVDRPLSELQDGEPEWEVEAIIGKKEELEEVELNDPEEGGSIDESPTESDEKESSHGSDSKEEKEEAASPLTVRRSARLAGKPALPIASQEKAKRRPPVKVKQMVLRYRVRWKGYSEEEASWERVENLANAQEAIDDYERQLADMRGEDTMGIHYLHTIVKDDQGRGATLQTMIVGSAPSRSLASN
jgi:chromodomain-containing protein